VTRPEFFNSAIVDVTERVVLAGGGRKRIRLAVRYGILRRPEGPVLIDTGYGPRATEGAGRSLLLKAYGAALKPQLVRGQLPQAVLAGMGYAADDISLIILTHFHPDHIAALLDFPNARIVTSVDAWQKIEAMGAFGRLRNGIFRELLPADFAERLVALEDMPEVSLPLELGQGRDVFGDGSCLSVDLPGHGLGHFGLCWPQGDRPLLYAVDVQWLEQAVMENRLPMGLARIAYHDEKAMRASADKVRRFAEMGGEVVLCHERVEA